MSISIFALATDAFGGRGGIAQYNRDFLSAISTAGYRIEVLPRFAPDPLGDLPQGLIQHTPVAGRVTYALKAFGLALRMRPDIVFCGHLHMVTFAALIAKFCGARLVLQVHGVEAWKRPSEPLRRSVEASALVLCVSRYTRERVLEWAAIAPECVVVLPNTVREMFTPSDRMTAKGKFGLSAEQVLLSVSRLDARERYKGHDGVIEALTRVVDEFPNVLYLIVGEGDDRERLERLVAERRLGPHVQFTGAVVDEDLPDLYRAADLFVLPSMGEGFGIVFLEAMACGVPALGLAVAGACDALGDDRFGFAMNGKEDLAARLVQLLRQPHDACVIASSVEERFGRTRFGVRARGLMDSLSSPFSSAHFSGTQHVVN